MCDFGKEKFFLFFLYITTLSTSFYTIFFLLSPYKVRRMYICFISNAESVSVTFLSHSSYRHSLYLHLIATNIFRFSSMLLIITQVNVTVLRLGFAIISYVFPSELSQAVIIRYFHLIVSCYLVAKGSYSSSTKPSAENTVNKSSI